MAETERNEELLQEEPAYLFINHSEMTVDGMAQALKGYMRTPSWIVLRVVIGLMACFGILLTVRGLVLGTDMQYVLPAVLIIVFALGIYFHRFVLYPAKKAQKVYEANKKKYKADSITVDYYFYDDHITSSILNDTAVSDIDYQNLQRVFQTPDFVILQTFGRKMLVLSPDGFEGGSIEEMYAHIRKRCPEALHEKKERQE